MWRLRRCFFRGRPIRLAHDRYQQFQGGIKRHAFKMQSRIGVDRASGRMTAFAADHVLDGGGLANYSASVAVVGATGAIGIYDIPKVDVTTVAEHSRGVTAGSMRGYGTLQTMTALEVLVDEAAAALPLDPIEFRRRNALKAGGRIDDRQSLLGLGPHARDPRQAGAASDLARPRRCRRRERRAASSSAPASPASPRTTAPAPIARSARSRSIRRAASRSTAIMSRWATASARLWPIAWRAHLAAVADEVTVAQVDVFDALGLVTSGDAYTITQAAQDEAARNPRWVPAISSATSASIGAHVGTQAAAEAARVVFRFGLWPAALELWGIPPADPRAEQWHEAFWQDGQLLLSGLSPLPLPAVAAQAHARNGVTGAMAHAFSRWAWSQATFEIGGEAWTADIDSLAVRHGEGEFARLDRSAVAFPPTDYNRIGTAFTSMCGTLVRVEIERATGALRIAKAYSVFECGQVLVPEVVLGQAQGGFAMGVGYALLETLPPFEDGPGNGQWNLGDYVVARGLRPAAARPRDRGPAAALAQGRPEGHGGSRDDPDRAGAAERHLRRHRPPFPVAAGNPRHAQGSAVVTSLALTINGRAYGPMDVRDDLTMNDFLREISG